MELDPKRFLFMSVGFFDYLREKFDELSEEFVERGRQRGEDIQEFLDDVVESIPFLQPKDDYDDYAAEERPKESLIDFLKDLDLKATARDLMALFGLSKGESDDTEYESSASDMNP